VSKDLNQKIYVAGHRGMVGSAIVRNLQAKGYSNIVTRTHAEMDLTDQTAEGDRQVCGALCLLPQDQNQQEE